MELAMNMGAFEALDNHEIMVVDGGKITFAGIWDAVCRGVTASAAGCIVASFVPGGAPAYLAATATAAVVAYVWDNI